MTTGTAGWILLSAALLAPAVTSCTAAEDAAPGQSPDAPITAVASSPASSTTPSPTTATTDPPTTTASPPTIVPSEVIHVFPIDPPEAATYTPGGHPYPATDLFAPEGTRFVAVTSGVVEGVSRTDAWDPEVDDGANRAGMFVSLVGDDGVRYYGSHLSAVAAGIDTGVRVAAGQLLGYVGRSGNARDTPPHLHFGISRPTYVDDWEVRRGEIDPVPFLDAWSAGDTTATPDV